MTDIVSPLRPLPRNDDPEARSFTDDFERQFFDGAEQVKVAVTLMRETWDDLLKVIEENEWKPNEGLIILLTTGMAYLNAERALSVSQGAADLSGEEVKKLLDRLMVTEARYASIKNFTFDIMRDHRILEIKYVPIERGYLNYKRMVLSLEKDNEALRAEVTRLKQGRRADEPALEASVSPEPRSCWRTLWSALITCLHRD